MSSKSKSASKKGNPAPAGRVAEPIKGVHNDNEWWVVLNSKTWFDADRIRIRGAVSRTGGDGKERWSSEGRYVDDNGKECRLLTSLPSQQLWLSPSYPYEPAGAKKTARTVRPDDDITGYQIKYLLNVDPDLPTEEEEFVRAFSEAYYTKVYEAMSEAVDVSEMPEKVDMYYQRSVKLNNPEKAVKPFFVHPKKEGGKKDEYDTTKPKAWYISLNTWRPSKEKLGGRDPTVKDIVCHTKVYGPGNKPCNPYRYKNTPGIATPVVEWQGVTWAPGGESVHGALIRHVMHELTWKPATTRAAPPRFAPVNDMPEEEEDIDSEDSDDTSKKASSKTSSKKSPKGTKTSSKKSSGDDNTKPGNYDDPFGSDNEQQAPVPSMTSAAKPAPKKAATPVTSDDDSNDAEEPVPPPKKQTAKPASKPAAKPLAKKPSKKSSDDDNDAPEAEEPAPKKQTADERREAILAKARLSKQTAPKKK